MNQQKLQADFERLVHEHKSTIYSVCFMFADTKDIADDLFQEVLIRLWDGFKDFRGECSIRSWVYRISLNTCISVKRKKRVKTVPLDFSPEIFDEGSSVGKQTAMLHNRILKLDKFDRAIVLLWLEDMAYEEIGAIVGISPKAVGVRLVRIKEKLKSL